MRYLLRHKLPLDSGEELDTGAQVLFFFVTTKVNPEGQPAGSDYDQQRQMYKAIKYLRGKGTECAIPMGAYMELEDAWYEHLMYQVKHWKWGVNDPGIFDLIEEWDKAAEKKPKTLPILETAQ